MDAYLSDTIRSWERLSYFRKPAIAAVGGLRAGRGLRTRHDVRIHPRRRKRQIRPARDQARHSPGAGGTQRLTRFVGKSKAMEMCLTGRMMDAQEAERAGLVSRIVPADKLLEEAMKTGG